VFNRVGKNGKDFKCFKFRSMSIEAKPDSASCDFVQVSHITKVGKFLRKTSIDELPQLINVLFGQMNLIGYRPVLRNEKALNDLRHKYGVYQLKPGITGYAQVNGRDLLGDDPYKKAEYDSYYVKHISPWIDIKILFKTVIVVLRKDGNIDGKVEKK
jgi:O-antigen biosynthesis protein WbqP